MDEQTALLREMRDLLLLIAEPAIAKRDEKLRTSLIEIVGKSKANAKAVPLMDGSRISKQICAESGIDPGQLSRLLKSLKDAGLIGEDDKHPKLGLHVPVNFFGNGEKKNG